MSGNRGSKDILAEENREDRDKLVEMLEKAYWMEIETVMSYVANSVNPDGVRASEIKESLQQDITEELGHAQQFAGRIKELYGTVPGSMEFKAEQSYLQPPEKQTDIPAVIKGVIEAEAGAIAHYNEVIEFAARLPAALKIKNGRRKHILKEAASGLLPDGILQRRKQGFAVPVASWFRGGGLRELFSDVLLSPRAQQRGYFEPRFMERLVREHVTDRRDHSARLWALVVFELWHRQYIDSTPSPAALRPATPVSAAS